MLAVMATRQEVLHSLVPAASPTHLARAGSSRSTAGHACGQSDLRLALSRLLHSTNVQQQLQVLGRCGRLHLCHGHITA